MERKTDVQGKMKKFGGSEVKGVRVEVGMGMAKRETERGGGGGGERERESEREREREREREQKMPSGEEILDKRMGLWIMRFFY